VHNDDTVKSSRFSPLRISDDGIRFLAQMARVHGTKLTMRDSDYNEQLLKKLMPAPRVPGVDR